MQVVLAKPAVLFLFGGGVFSFLFSAVFSQYLGLPVTRSPHYRAFMNCLLEATSRGFSRLACKLGFHIFPNFDLKFQRTRSKINVSTSYHQEMNA